MDTSLLFKHRHRTLEGLADALVRRLPRDKDRPFYSESGFEQKLRVAYNREKGYSRHCTIRSPVDGLLVAELDFAIRHAGLTERQRAALWLKAQGDAQSKIAKALGVSRQRVCCLLNSAMGRIIRAWKSSPYRGLREVYLSEVKRGVRR